MRGWIFIVLVCSVTTSVGAEFEIETACLDCHRPGQTRGEVPLIEGQQRDYLQTQLTRFRELHREGFPMTGLAAGLDPPAVDRLADVLSKRSWQSATVAVSNEAVARGRERAEALECAACHGEHYLGSSDIPRLAGQHPGYLHRQLQSFGAGDRHHPLTGVGTRMYELSGREARDLAAFLHALPFLENESERVADSASLD